MQARLICYSNNHNSYIRIQGIARIHTHHFFPEGDNVDDAIDMVTATLSVTPLEETDAIDQLAAQLEMFQELKKLQADGEDASVIFNIKVGE